jgi:hypothetical protein
VSILGGRWAACDLYPEFLHPPASTQHEEHTALQPYDEHTVPFIHHTSLHHITTASHKRERPPRGGSISRPFDQLPFFLKSISMRARGAFGIYTPAWTWMGKRGLDYPRARGRCRDQMRGDEGRGDEMKFIEIPRTIPGTDVRYR